MRLEDFNGCAEWCSGGRGEGGLRGMKWPPCVCTNWLIVHAAHRLRPTTNESLHGAAAPSVVLRRLTALPAWNSRGPVGAALSTGSPQGMAKIHLSTPSTKLARATLHMHGKFGCVGQHLYTFTTTRPKCS